MQGMEQIAIRAVRECVVVQQQAHTLVHLLMPTNVPERGTCLEIADRVCVHVVFRLLRPLVVKLLLYKSVKTSEERLLNIVDRVLHLLVAVPPTFSTNLNF